MKKLLGRVIRKLVGRFKQAEISSQLPKNTKYYSPFIEWDDLGYKTGVLIVQYAPQFRTVFGGSERYFVPFPHSVFIIRFVQKYKPESKTKLYEFRSVQVGFITDPLKSPDDEIAPLPLSNYEEGDGLSYLRICMGGSFGNPVRNSLQELVDHVVGSFWQSNFTSLNDKIMQNWTKLNLNNVWNCVYGVPGQDPWWRMRAARRAKISELVKIPQNVEKFDA